VLIDAARETPGVLDRPGPDCSPVEFGESAIVYALRIWIDKFSQQSDIVGEILTRVWYVSNRAGLEISGPVRTTQVSKAEEAQPNELPEWEIGERVLALNRLDMFLALESSEKQDLARRMKKVPFAAGETIIRQGEAGDSLYLIADGQVRVALQKESADRTLTRMGPGNFFGEMSLMTGEPRTATVAALTDVVCFVIDRTCFQQILTSRPDIAADMSALLAVRQATLKKKGGELSAAIAQANETKRILDRIRAFFHVG
jgi:CRP-like cAMP-binding protein